MHLTLGYYINSDGEMRKYYAGEAGIKLESLPSGQRIVTLISFSGKKEIRGESYILYSSYDEVMDIVFGQSAI